MKTCAICKEELPIDNFRKISKYDDKPFSYCKPCESSYKKQIREKNFIRYRTRERKRKLEEIGWSEELYDSTFEKQNGCCAICGTDIPGGRWNRFFADHNHSNGQARGLLCFHCNTALGVVEAKGINTWMDQVKKYLEDNN